MARLVCFGDEDLLSQSRHEKSVAIAARIEVPMKIFALTVVEINGVEQEQK